MKTLFFCLFLTSFRLFAGGPWPNLPYAEARAYYYNEIGNDSVPLVKDGQLDASVVTKEGVLMPKATVKKLLTILNTKKFESLYPACYSPRHGVVFYDRDKKVVAVYEVCFECMLQRSEPAGLAPLTDLPAVARIFEQLKLSIGPGGKTAKSVKKSWEQLSTIQGITLKPIK